MRQKIDYKFVGGSQNTRPPVYGDVVEITRGADRLQGIVYEIDNENLSNSKVFVRQYGGDLTRLGNNYTIRDPSPDLNRQIIANNFGVWWWNTFNNRVYIIDWNLTRPPNLPPQPEAPNNSGNPSAF